MNKIEELKQIVAQLRRLFPDGYLNLGIWDNYIGLTCHGPKTYLEATEFMRQLGVGIRHKTPHDTFTSLTGEVNGVTVTTMPDELPPTCRRVKKIERVPKTKVVETGEYYQVERDVIECGAVTVRFEGCDGKNIDPATGLIIHPKL